MGDSVSPSISGDTILDDNDDRVNSGTGSRLESLPSMQLQGDDIFPASDSPVAAG